MKSLFSEFKRRNVFRVAALYLVSAWLIAQVADVVIGLGELPPAIGRTVLILLALGFPVALAAAWLFQWTPEGIRREPEVATAPSPAEQSAGRRLDYVIISLLSVALVYFIINHDWQEPLQIADASIAVLPFENRSAQPDDLYFTDGIHEDILSRLAKIGSLLVISRTSVLPYRDSGKAIPEIARELGVATVLEGSVQRAGNKVRVSLQLIDAASDRHLWTASYDRELSAENLFAIQSEVAASIAEALQAQLLPSERRRIDAIPTHNLEAYDAYLLGQRHMSGRRSAELVKAREYFERAIRLDPTFALAYSALADTLLLLTSYSELPRDSLIGDAEAAARKALELNPDLGEAHTSFGLLMWFRGDPPSDYGPSLQRGVELAPGSADALKWYASYLGELNRNEEALKLFEKAVQLDPMSPIIRINLSGTLWDLGRREEAMVQYKRALEIDPRFEPAMYSIWESGMIEDILLTLSQSYQPANPDPRVLREFALNYLTLGDGTRAEAWAAEAERVAPGSVSALIARLNVSAYEYQYTAAREAATKMLDSMRGVTFPSRVLLTYELREGDLQAAQARHQERFPDLLGDDPSVADNYPVAIDLAILFRAMGEPEKAERLLLRSLEYLATLPAGSIADYGVHLARIQAMEGQTGEALATLRRTLDAGWSFQWWFYLIQDAAFDAARGDPNFQILVEEMRAKMAWQLTKVRQLEANGKIALPPGS